MSAHTTLMKTLNESKRWRQLGLAVILGVSWMCRAQQGQPPPVYIGPSLLAQTPAAAPPATPAPPPAAPAKRSAADLEKLVAPIALYPDALIATILPASVYPLEIVQAARFVADTNNIAKLDAQPWDENVKAVARVPDAIKKLNEDLEWTMQLGDAFLAQDKDVMDTIQALRGKAQQVGTLKTTPEQVVVVTNMVVETRVEQQVVVVTNTVVQIQPSNPEVIYVPTYNPAVVYYPPPPTYVGPPPVVSFAAGVAVGAIIANNCDWHYGGCYHGDVDIDINRNVNVNQNVNANRNANVNSARSTGAGQTSTQKKWQPDQSRLSKSGTPSAASSARSAEARGWSSGGAGVSSGSAGARPSAGAAGPRPSTGAVGAGPSAGAAAARPTPSAGSVGARPSTGAAAARPSTGTPSASRPAASPSVSQPRSSPSASRPSPSSSAFGGMSSGASTRDMSSRGAASRSSGGGGFSGGRGGGGGRR